MSPVDGRIATRALAGPTSARAFWAARCAGMSMVVLSEVPGFASAVYRVRRLPWSSTATTVAPRVPASCSSYLFWRPEMPTSSPARIRPLLSLTSSAVAGPTLPRMAEAKSLSGASGSLSAMVRAPGMPSTPSSTSSGTALRR